jgi:hypothetical protein
MKIMTALLRGARVFSNETENNASVKQEMTTNINVKLRGDNNNKSTNQQGVPQTPRDYGQLPFAQGPPPPLSYPSTQGIIYPTGTP